MNSLPPGGGERGVGHWKGSPENHIKLTTYGTIQYRIPVQNNEYRTAEYRIIQNTAAAKTHVHKITNNLFFYMALELNDSDGGNSILGPLEGVGPKISTSWVQMALASLVAIAGPKKYRFSGSPPPLPIALEMDLPLTKSLRPAPF